jgi:hypothetical protein
MVARLAVLEVDKLNIFGSNFILGVDNQSNMEFATRKFYFSRGYTLSLGNKIVVRLSWPSSEIGRFGGR